MEPAGGFSSFARLLTGTFSLYGNATRVSRKKNHNVVSGWIAVLRLLRNIGWGKMGTSSGGTYWKLRAFRRNPDPFLKTIVKGMGLRI